MPVCPDTKKAKVQSRSDEPPPDEDERESNQISEKVRFRGLQIRQRLGKDDWRTVDQFETEVRTFAMPVVDLQAADIVAVPRRDAELPSHQGDRGQHKHRRQPRSELNFAHSTLDTGGENTKRGRNEGAFKSRQRFFRGPLAAVCPFYREALGFAVGARPSLAIPCPTFAHHRA